MRYRAGVATANLLVLIFSMSGCIDLMPSDDRCQLPGKAPSVHWHEDEAEDSMSLLESHAMTWDCFSMKAASPASVQVWFNGARNSTCFLTEDYQKVTDCPRDSPSAAMPRYDAPLDAEDNFRFCDPARRMLADVRITLLHDASNSVMNEYTYATIAACPA